MARIHYELREIHLKVVYFGPHGSGKTTAIAHIHRAAAGPPGASSASGPSAGEYLPLSLGAIRGFTTTLHLYAVSGAPEHERERLALLEHADGVIFLADGSAEALAENRASHQELVASLAHQGFAVASLPYVLQVNKQDLPNAIDAPQLATILGVAQRPFFGSVATTGGGVFEALKEVSRQVLRTLRGPAPA